MEACCQLILLGVAFLTWRLSLGETVRGLGEWMAEVCVCVLLLIEQEELAKAPSLGHFARASLILTEPCIIHALNLARYVNAVSPALRH